MKLYNPSTISHFRKIRAKHRNGQTPEQMKAKHDARQATKTPFNRVTRMSVAGWVQKGQKLENRPRNVRAIPLGAHTADGIKALIDNRKKNWRTTTATSGKSRIESHDLGRYSSRCQYTHYEYTRRIESWGAVVGTNLFARIDTAAGIRTRTIKAPRGYRWNIDKNGIRILSLTNPRCDYHPTAAEILNQTDLRKLAKENLKKRVELAKLERKEKKEVKRAADLIKKAEREGATVCLADSVRAGNCRAGTEAWARRHGLDPAKHYAPSQLLKIANGDAKRVGLAVAAAIRRHRIEMDRGFAELAEHRI